MIKKFAFVLLAGWAGSVIAADVWTPGYVWNAAANTGEDVWFGPGNKVTTNGAFARGANVLASGTGYNIVETGSVALRDGRAVTLTASRFASATAMAAATARLAAGPVGIVAVLAIPAVYDWITAEGGKNIRVNAERTGVEKRDGCFADCYAYEVHTTFPGYVSGQFATAQGACSANQGAFETYYGNGPVTSLYVGGSLGIDCMGYAVQYGGPAMALFSLRKIPRVADSGTWYPSSMDDISPYMTPRLPSQTYPKQIVDAGAEIDLSPVSITGPSPALPQKDLTVTTTNYPEPADKTSTTVSFGNKFNLPDSIATNTDVSTGTASLSPGSSTSSGPPRSSPLPPPGPVMTPTQSTTSSTYNPTTNQTTSTTTTSQDGASKTTSTQNTTNITNTTNSSTVNITNVTTTTITNTTTNTPLAPPIVDTDPGSEPPQTDCEKNPDSVGCAKMDVPTDKVPEKTVTITWVEENLGFGAGACPAPFGFNTSLGSYELNLSQYCTFITTYVRPLVLLFSLLAAFFIVAPIRQD